MSYVIRQVAKDLLTLEKAISECISNRERYEPVNGACRAEIDHAKEHQEDEEVKQNIITTHEKQIRDNLYAMRQNEIKYEASVDAYNRIRSLYFPGILGTIKLFIYKVF